MRDLYPAAPGAVRPGKIETVSIECLIRAAAGNYCALHGFCVMIKGTLLVDILVRGDMTGQSYS